MHTDINLYIHNTSTHTWVNSESMISMLPSLTIAPWLMFVKTELRTEKSCGKAVSVHSIRTRPMFIEMPCQRVIREDRPAKKGDSQCLHSTKRDKKRKRKRENGRERERECVCVCVYAGCE